MSYSYYVTAHKPTSVICCASGNFTGPQDINLITARSNRLHIDLVSDSCLVSLKEFALNGKIEIMKTFRRDFDQCDLLFIVTSRLHAMILSCRKSETGELSLETEAYGSVSDPVGRPSENGMLAIIDPQSRLIGLRLYDGLFKIIPLDRDNVELKSTNIRMDELQVQDVQFLHGTTNPTIILIHQDGNGRHIKTHEISLRDKEFIRTPWVHSNTESEASIIIPVAKPTCGALIIGEQSILYNDGITDLAVAPVAFKNTSIVCYVSIPDRNNYILADMNGKLYGLDLKTEERSGSMVASEIHVYRLCETSIADSLTYLGDNQLFIGSKFGNSQFIRLNVDGHTCKLEILQSFTNLGPIVDMCVVDLEKQGQNQLVTCSGALKEGSLKIIRNGIGIYENAAIDLPGVKGMWSIVLGEIDCADSMHNTLVLSFVERTRFLFLIGEEVEMIESDCFITNKRTFLCMNVVHNQIIQITPLSIRLINQANKKVMHEWKAMATTSKNISLAAANKSQIVCAYGNELFYLEIVAGELCERGKFTFDFELSCLDITPFASCSKSDYVVLGLWTDLSVQVLKLPEMRMVHYEKLDGEIIPRSIIMVTFEKTNYVLCSLGDGTMFYFQMMTANGQLVDRKKVTLGSQPIILKLFRSLSSTNVFACSDRPTVIHSLNNKLIFSNVNLKEVNHMCSLNSEAYPDSLALATENLVIIGTIDQIQKLHIRSIPLHETPRRIVHQERNSCFAVITTRVDFQTPKGLKPSRPSASTEAPTVSYSTGFGSLGTALKIASATSSSSASASSSSAAVTVATCSGVSTANLLNSSNRNDSETTVQEVDTSTLLIIDQNTFETLHAHQFVPNEYALSVISCTLANDPNVYFVVGTAVVYPDETEPKIGRLIILQLIDNRLVQIAEKEVKGACYSIAEFNGKILVTINSTVRLFEWTTEKELRVECSYFNNTVALYLKRKGEFVLVGDLMRSLTLLQYKQMEGNFEEIGHDTNPNWTTAVEIIDDDLFLASENAMHLYVCQKDGIASTDDERLIMQTVGRFHLGESVNVFRHGSLVIQDIGNVSDLVSNSILMGTVDGAIGLVAQLRPSLFKFLEELQTKMAKMIPTIGKIDHSTWRSFSNEFRSEPPCGFIDGDLIESFLDLSYDTQKSICDAVSESESIQSHNVEQVIRIIEELTRIH